MSVKVSLRPQVTGGGKKGKKGKKGKGGGTISTDSTSSNGGGVDQSVKFVCDSLVGVYCGTGKEAQNVASTVALYKLAPDSQVYRRFPPVFRDLWLGWMEEDILAREEEQADSLKGRNTFIER